MTKQKSNVKETSKSPASKRRRRHSTLSNDKLQLLTTTNNISLETYYFKETKATFIDADT